MLTGAPYNTAEGETMGVFDQPWWWWALLALFIFLVCVLVYLRRLEAQEAEPVKQDRQQLWDGHLGIIWVDDTKEWFPQEVDNAGDSNWHMRVNAKKELKGFFLQGVDPGEIPWITIVHHNQRQVREIPFCLRRVCGGMLVDPTGLDWEETSWETVVRIEWSQMNASGEKVSKWRGFKITRGEETKPTRMTPSSMV